VKHEAIIEVMDFLNKIEGDGYGGMAIFEIAREHVRHEYRQSLGRRATAEAYPVTLTNGDGNTQ
jgi:hypothetical protein